MDAVRQYTSHLERKGCKPSSIKTSRYRLDSFFAIDQPSGGLAMTNVSRLTPEQCTSLYDEQTRRMSVDTHRSTLTLAKTFGQWCVKQGWIAASPLAAIEPIRTTQAWQGAAPHQRGARLPRDVRVVC